MLLKQLDVDLSEMTVIIVIIISRVLVVDRALAIKVRVHVEIDGE